MMTLLDLAQWPLYGISALFIAAAAVIAVAGARLTRIADRLADATGLGEALFGAVLLGATTSLPGIVTSVVAALQGYPELAVSNAVGGIAAQTVFLAIADMSHRGINLEHAAASVENLVQGALLVTLLALPVLALSGPELAPFGVHPASLALLVGYGFGIKLVASAKAEPLWQPQRTPETREDQGSEANDEDPWRLWLRFVPLGAAVAAAGYLVAVSGAAEL